MARVINDGDLLYKKYKWSAYPGDDPKITGKPDSTLLNRGEGYEMSYFIDRYMKSKEWKQASTGQKIEKFLKESTLCNQSHATWRKELDNKFTLKK